jgi:hypothetical protein
LCSCIARAGLAGQGLGRDDFSAHLVIAKRLLAQVLFNSTTLQNSDESVFFFSLLSSWSVDLSINVAAVNEPIDNHRIPVLHVLQEKDKQITHPHDTLSVSQEARLNDIVFLSTCNIKFVQRHSINHIEDDLGTYHHVNSQPRCMIVTRSLKAVLGQSQP